MRNREVERKHRYWRSDDKFGLGQKRSPLKMDLLAMNYQNEKGRKKTTKKMELFEE